jgi:hypothetical protein
LQFFDGFDLVKPGLVDISEWHLKQDSPQVKIKPVGVVGRKGGLGPAFTQPARSANRPASEQAEQCHLAPRASIKTG